MRQFINGSDSAFIHLKTRAKRACVVFPDQEMPLGARSPHARVGFEVNPTSGEALLLVQRGIEYNGTNQAVREWFARGQKRFGSFEQLQHWIQEELSLCYQPSMNLSTNGFQRVEQAYERSLERAEQEAHEIVNRWASAAALVEGLLDDTHFSTGVDMQMISDVARVFGVTNYDPEAVITVITATAGRYAAQTVVVNTIGSIHPVIEVMGKSVIAAAVTKAVGEALINYFKTRSPYR